MANSAGQKASGAADADEYQSKLFKLPHCRHPLMKAEPAWHASPVLTYEIVGLSDVVVPHGHLQGLFGEVCIFYVVTELLQKIEGQKIRAPFSGVITYNYNYTSHLFRSCGSMWV